jgi:type IV pilus assembly protein PilV
MGGSILGKKQVPVVPALISPKDKAGFTLIEVMVAILILMVGMLGLLQAINLATEVNMRNQVREEAVYAANRVMSEMKSGGFDNISVASTPTQTYTYATYQIPSKIRGASKSYNVIRSSRVLSTVDAKPATKELAVLVTWNYKGVEYQNRVVAPFSILR